MLSANEKKDLSDDKPDEPELISIANTEQQIPKSEDDKNVIFKNDNTDILLSVNEKKDLGNDKPELISIVNAEQQSIRYEEDRRNNNGNILLSVKEKDDSNIEKPDESKFIPDINAEQQAFKSEDGRDVLIGNDNTNIQSYVDKKEDSNTDKPNESNYADNVYINTRIPEDSGRQNIRTVSKSGIKDHRIDEANRPGLVSGIPEEKASIPSADKAQTKSEMKEKFESIKANAELDMEKNAAKSSNENNADAKKEEYKNYGLDNKINDFDKEVNISANNNSDKNMTVNRMEFQDFMYKILEQRNNSSKEFSAQPQQMNLINRGRSAFSESVENVVRFIRIGAFVKANLIVDPPALGKVNIEIVSTDNGIEAVLKVSNEQVKMLVQDQLAQLKQNLEQAGVKLAEFSVDVQQEKDRSRDQSFNNKPGKTRLGVTEEEESEAERIEVFRVDLRKGLLHWIA